MARLEDLTTAYDAQQAAVVGWLEALPAPAWDEPSRLAGWTVRDLAFHATTTTSVVVAALARGPVREPAVSIADYIAALPAAAGEILERDRDAASGRDAAGVIAAAALARADVTAALAGVTGDPVVASHRGAIRLSDLMATRVNEVVAHSLDLSASVPAVEPVPMDRKALGVACRMLTGILAEQVPGHTVEVRVPPYAAIQCVAGPRHTRGTPANVVEIEPVTWVELATGRIDWAEVVGTPRVSASGDRADLSAHLPVLS